MCTTVKQSKKDVGNNKLQGHESASPRTFPFPRRLKCLLLVYLRIIFKLKGYIRYAGKNKIFTPSSKYCSYIRTSDV